MQECSPKKVLVACAHAHAGCRDSRTRVPSTALTRPLLEQFCSQEEPPSALAGCKRGSPKDLARVFPWDRGRRTKDLVQSFSATPRAECFPHSAWLPPCVPRAGSSRGRLLCTQCAPAPGEATVTPARSACSSLVTTKGTPGLRAGPGQDRRLGRGGWDAGSITAG